MKKNELLYRFLTSIFITPVFLIIIIKGFVLFNFFLVIIFFISLYEWHRMIKHKKFIFFSGQIFLLLSFYYTYLLRGNSYSEMLFFLFTLLICISTDIGGFFFGKILKGPKLTKISPNKTFSGMLGAFILSFISSNLLAF